MRLWTEKALIIHSQKLFKYNENVLHCDIPCAKIKTINAKGDLMKRTLTVLAALLVILASFTGCDAISRFIPGKTASLGEKTDGVTPTLEGAVMKYESNTSGSLTVTIVNGTESTWQSANMKDYRLEAEKDGEWYAVEQKGEFANTMELMIFAPGESMTHTFDFSTRYGRLTPGRYRVVKTYWANATENMEAHEFHLSCEFDVE
jgi:hypothetical protein